MHISNSIQRKSIWGANDAFTLVETLVAIAILMIAIAGPLVVASKGLTAAQYAKNQSVASFLAQEGMELIRNVKDTDSFSNATGFSTTFIGRVSGCSLTSYCSVDLNTGTGAINISSGVTNMGIFTRKFYITNVNANEITVTVIVSWTQGNVSNEVRLVSQMVAEIL